jgi:hypothetical protein
MKEELNAAGAATFATANLSGGGFDVRIADFGERKEQAKLRHVPLCLLRLVALVLPLGEQRELVRCPIGPSGWHGRRVAFVRRKCFEHFVSIVRIGHEGVIVQLYAVRLHMRNIDIAKQWPDITRERNLGHNVLLLTGNAECEICKQNIKKKTVFAWVRVARAAIARLKAIRIVKRPESRR